MIQTYEDSVCGSGDVPHGDLAKARAGILRGQEPYQTLGPSVVCGIFGGLHPVSEILRET